MPIVTRIVDQGASTPLAFPIDVSGNPVIYTLTKLAEFGLRVDTPEGGVPGTNGIFNFVHLDASVGLRSSFEGTRLVRIVITKRNSELFPSSPVFQPGIDEIVAEFLESVDEFENEVISVNFTEGGQNKPLAPGYFGYALWIQLASPVLPPPTIFPEVIGPISFSGESSVRENLLL
jgi:hypothetical protein